MTMILDVATSISCPDSMILFDDTTHRVVHYAPREWRLLKVNGVSQIQYNEWPNDDIAFLSMVFAPFVEPSELDELKQDAHRTGLTVQPVRYLGKSDSGSMSSQLTLPYSFPADSNFRCEVNGGQGGSFANPVPLVFSTNLRVGRILSDIISDVTKPVGLAGMMRAAVRGATTSFHAVVTVNYDRTYEMLSVHTSWSWWLWSGDFQAAWQKLTVSGAVTVEILGGTADQKTIAYKMAEWLRDMFFKAELGNVTTPSHPNSGVIRTSVRYERQHEHKTFRVEFNERDFTEAPFAAVAHTGTHKVKSFFLDTDNTHLLELQRAAAARAMRVEYDPFPESMLRADWLRSLLLQEGRSTSAE